jgi:hypothetical protein
MPVVRQQLEKTGLPRDTLDIIMASWRKNTGKQYNSYLSQWVVYCQTNNIISDKATIHDGLGFLTTLYKRGLGYSAINTARSALSTLIGLADNITFREQSLVVRFLKGIFELKPSLPRYSVTYLGCWDSPDIPSNTTTSSGITLENPNQKTNDFTVAYHSTEMSDSN